MNNIISLKKQTSYLFLGKFLSFVIKFLTPVILVRLISKESFGIYRQFDLITSTFIPIFTLGFGSSVLYFYPILAEKIKKNFLFQTYILQFTSGVLLVGVFYLFSHKIMTWIGITELNSYNILISLFILFMVISSLNEFYFSVERKIYHNLIYFPIDSLIRLLLIIFLVSFYKNEKGCIYAISLYAFIRFLYFTIYSFKNYSSNKIDISIVKKQIVYSLPLAFSIVITTLISRVDKFLIVGIVPVEKYAVYTIAFMGIPLLNELYSSINNILVPEITKQYFAGNILAVSYLWKKSVEKIASVTLPIVLFFVIMSNKIILILFTASYLEAVPFFKIFLMLYILFMFNRGIVLRAANKTLIILSIDSICFIITLIVGWFAIPKFLLNGAMFTSCIGVALPICFKIIFEKSIMKVSIQNWLPWSSLWKIVVSSFIPATIIIILNYYITNNVMAILICSIVYISLVFSIQYKLNVFIYMDVIDRNVLITLKKWIWCQSNE